ncbi:MAG: hypothetical protein HYU37_09160 [Acidobacteria bacterium]|nr:hypothetical protein [Acidobacteriota bacterium]
MPADVLEALFPRLREEGYEIKSEIDPAYNCIAFSLDDNERWWEPFRPDGFWPEGVELNDTLNGFVALFQAQGFVVCEDGNVEAGFEKIALYGNAAVNAFAHVARLSAAGVWVSKLGELEDIEHNTLEALTSHGYGEPVMFLKRPTVREE